MKVFIDGEFFEKDDARISIFDYGFLYGYGAFTTLTTYRKKILFLTDHIDRLFESAEVIGIIPVWDKKQVMAWVIKTYEMNSTEQCEVRIRVNISKGENPDVNIEGNKQCKPSLSIIVSQLPFHSDESYRFGISMLTVNLERVFPRSKNFNFLPSIIALNEAKNKGYYDALLVDKDGFITEATTGNVFFFRDNVLYTTSSRILEGITRLHIIKAAQRCNIRVKKKMFKLGELLNADEVFITGTTKAILPVSQINDKKIGNHTCGILTRKLRDYYSEYLDEIIKQMPQDDRISNKLII